MPIFMMTKPITITLDHVIYIKQKSPKIKPASSINTKTRKKKIINNMEITCKICIISLCHRSVIMWYAVNMLF